MPESRRISSVLLIFPRELERRSNHELTKVAQLQVSFGYQCSFQKFGTIQARLCDSAQLERFEQSIHRFEMILQDGWIFLVCRFDDIFDGDVMQSFGRDERLSSVHQGFLCC